MVLERPNVPLADELFGVRSRRSSKRAGVLLVNAWPRAARFVFVDRHSPTHFEKLAHEFERAALTAQETMIRIESR